MTPRNRYRKIKRSLLYTHEGMVGDESELRLSLLGAENPIAGAGVVLDSCVLDRVRLKTTSGIRFQSCELETIDGAIAVINESSWRSTTVTESRLTGAQINFSHLDQVLWQTCQMPLAQFQESTLKRVEFISCDLSGAFFNGAQMEGTIFAGSNLNGADFSEANLDGCDFRRANIEGIRIAPDQLQGVIVTADQALYLARLFGLVIQE